MGTLADSWEAPRFRGLTPMGGEPKSRLSAPKKKFSIFCLPFLYEITYKRNQHEIAVGARCKEGPENPSKAEARGRFRKRTKPTTTKKIFLKKPTQYNETTNEKNKPKEKQII
jgi:hypothetical protein